MLNYKDCLRYNELTMKSGDELTLKIEKLSSDGKGIAKIDGFVIFVENSCPDDFLKVKITKLNKNFAFAEIIEIITPSKDRTEPFCPMQKVCGACQLQFIDYEKQLTIKKQITQDAIKTIGGLDTEVKETIPSPEIKNYRHKIQYPVSQTKNSKRILAGYYKQKTHEIVNIKYCPIQPEICDEIIEFIRQHAADFHINAYCEKKHNGLLRHIVIRHSAANGSSLVVLVINNHTIPEKLKEFADLLYSSFENIAGVCVNFNDKKTNVILGNKTVCLKGSEYIEEKLLDINFKIGANTFFQINPKSAENIFKYVKNYIKSNFKNPLILDAYAGISAFGLCMADICQTVVTVEENSQSCELAKFVAKENNIQNIEINNMDAGKYFSGENRQFDAIILDPPRKGCSQLSLDEALRLSKDTIIYVSCNPATLARDLKYLTQNGCQVESVQPFDMFCHTYHVENVAVIKVNK